MRLPSSVAVLWLVAVPFAASEERFEVDAFWGFSTSGVGATIREPAAVSFDETFAQGFLLGARFVFRFGDRIGLEAAYRYSPNGVRTVAFEDPFFGGVDLVVPSDLQSHAFIGSVLYDLTQSERIRPFVLGGLGVEYFDDGEGQNALCANLGGGVRFHLREGLGLRVDARYVLWPSFYMTDEHEGAVEVHAGLAIGF